MNKKWYEMSASHILLLKIMICFEIFLFLWSSYTADGLHNVSRQEEFILSFCLSNNCTKQRKKLDLSASQDHKYMRLKILRSGAVTTNSIRRFFMLAGQKCWQGIRIIEHNPDLFRSSSISVKLVTWGGNNVNTEAECLYNHRLVSLPCSKGDWLNTVSNDLNTIEQRK